jgi:internalin A
MSAVPVASPWRTFLRFSVRGLIVIVLVIGVSLGWLVRSARIQREAVAVITRAGGVKYNWGWTSEDYNPGVKPLKPGNLAGRIGIDYFAHVTDVRLFWSSQSINEAIVQVGRLNRLERLTVHQFSVSDARVAQLKGLTNVSQLTLDAVECTDAGLAQLSGLTNLSKLDLSATEVTDAGLPKLRRLTKLSELVPMATRITDAGLHLKGLKNLTKLDVSGTRVSDAGLRQLRGLSNLSELTL